MRLEIRHYPVERVVPGPATRLAGRTLEVDLAGLRDDLAADPRVAGLTVDLVAPGDSVRLARVFDQIEPRVKLAGPAGDFPGILSPVRRAGAGRANALKGVAVTVCNPDDPSLHSALDLGGAGARWSEYANLHHVVLSAAAPPGISAAEHQRGLLEAGLKAAVALARTTIEREAAAVEVFDLPPLLAPAPTDLPRIGYVYQIRSQQRPTLDDEPILYGSNVRHLLPTLLHPNEVLDGALTTGYHLFQTETYAIQNHPVITALARRHGTELWVSGVIAIITTPAPEDRARNVAMAVGLAADVLGLDGVLLTKTAGGMPETDLMLVAEGCEQAGVKTALIVWERLTNGRSESPLTVFSPLADAIVSTGDRDAWITLPPVARVIGSPDPADAGTLRLRLYEVHGGISQLGAGHFTAVDT
ncbi:MAG TPA: glycine/sarcosine/betaine reductase component B subunit [Chloroflexota bacterium]|nr:glycine/sarcosine/betaine reductase component B subunit [Chloroflexota bacterium]